MRAAGSGDAPARCEVRHVKRHAQCWERGQGNYTYETSHDFPALSPRTYVRRVYAVAWALFSKAPSLLPPTCTLLFTFTCTSAVQ